jgi:hypothetical protein
MEDEKTYETWIIRDRVEAYKNLMKQYNIQF